MFETISFSKKLDWKLRSQEAEELNGGPLSTC